MLRELYGSGSFVAWSSLCCKSLPDNERTGTKWILSTVVRTSRAQRLSSTAVYPPCPTTPHEPSHCLRIRARRIHCFYVRPRVTKLYNEAIPTRSASSGLRQYRRICSGGRIPLLHVSG